MTYEEQLQEKVEDESSKIVTNIRLRSDSQIPYYDAIRVAIYMTQKLYAEEVMYKNGEPEPEYFWNRVTQHLRANLEQPIKELT